VVPNEDSHRENEQKTAQKAPHAGCGQAGGREYLQRFQGDQQLPRRSSPAACPSRKRLKDLNYLPSFDKRPLQHPRTRIIYFLLANRDLNIPFHSRVLQSIEKECSRQGDLLLFRTLRCTPQMAPEDLNIPQLLQLPLSDKKRAFPDGVILTGITSPNLRQALKDAGLPVLLLGNNY
jgi:hypothetical protein